MKEAIQKAREGGYDTEGKWLHGVHSEGMLLDPLFWQALGKALGWGKLMTSREGVRTRDTYMVYWHDFINHLAEGKSAESFFTTLLSK